jgi:hypothetical protein
MDALVKYDSNNLRLFIFWLFQENSLSPGRGEGILLISDNLSIPSQLYGMINLKEARP